MAVARYGGASGRLRALSLRGLAGSGLLGDPERAHGDRLCRPWVGRPRPRPAGLAGGLPGRPPRPAQSRFGRAGLSAVRRAGPDRHRAQPFTIPSGLGQAGRPRGGKAEGRPGKPLLPRRRAARRLSRGGAGCHRVPGARCFRRGRYGDHRHPPRFPGRELLHPSGGGRRSGRVPAPRAAARRPASRRWAGRSTPRVFTRS